MAPPDATRIQAWWPRITARRVRNVIDPNVREVQERLQRALGLKVHIEDHNGHGKVIIEYGKLEDFDTLLEQLAGD